MHKTLELKMLYLIGLGLDLHDISMKALEALKHCKKVFLEKYTSVLPYSKQQLEKLIKKKLIIASRDLVENRIQCLLDEAKKQDVALLVYGDPLVATTHNALLLEAKKQKIKTKVIHAPSILTAVSETGLHLYKFGKTTSLPKCQEGYEPTSWCDTIKQNLSIDAHSLVLVDIGLEASDALNQLVEVKEFLNRFVIICSRLGTSKQKIIKGKLSELISKKLDVKHPYCIIIPASLHFTEAEALLN